VIKGGKGGARTLTGLRFEDRTNLEVAIASIPNYAVKDNIVYFKDKKIAELYKKHALYKRLLEPNGVDYSKIISQKLLPDNAILLLKHKILYIVEIKFQEVAGSVDEKLQTCGFKLRQYKKLLTPLKIDVEYIYVLDDWFQQDRYKDVLEYVKLCGCKYFFNEIPLNALGLPRPKRGDFK